MSAFNIKAFIPCFNRPPYFVGGTFSNWAFTIIFIAYATTVAAMIPLWNAGAGLIRGLAIVIIIGVSVGVFIARPAFASVMEKLLKE